MDKGHRVRVSKRSMSDVLMNACRIIKVTVTRMKCGTKCETLFYDQLHLQHQMSPENHQKNNAKNPKNQELLMMQSDVRGQCHLLLKSFILLY